MKIKILKLVLILAIVGLAVNSYAVKVLQVGAPAGPGDSGTYADYIDSLFNPTEEDTAVTSGYTLLVSGLFDNDNVVHLGGKNGSSLDWSGITWKDGNYFPGVFDEHEAILIASVPDGYGSSAYAQLMIDGNKAFSWSSDTSYFPNFHDPLKETVSDFLFFDIGYFSELYAIPNFEDEELGSKLGEIKELTLGGVVGLEWIHFDVIALEISNDGSVALATNLENNAGSHDVTWKVPEPMTLILLGFGLLGLAGIRRK